MWSVRNRMGMCALRTNNAAEAFRGGSPSGVDAGYRPPAWAFIASFHPRQNIADRDLVDIEGGAGRKLDKKQEARNASLRTPAGWDIWKIGAPPPRLPRGVGRNSL